MKININKRYHLDQFNDVDELCVSLDCWEQQLYFNLKEYNINCKLFFCNDINIRFFKESNFVERNYIYPNNTIFCVREWEYSKDTSEIIKQELDNDKILSICTSFNLLEPYIWYNNNLTNPHINHFMTLVGYDEKNYYFSESPLLINKNWKNKWEENKCIYEIRKDKLLQVCSLYSKICAIDVFEEKAHCLRDLHETIQNIISNYNNCNVNIYLGKKALQEFQTVLTKGESVEFLKDHFPCHLIASRHLILKWCLEEDCIYMKCSLIGSVLDCLDKAIQLWSKLCKLILLNTYNPQDKFIDKVIEYLQKIMEIEDQFILYLIELEAERKELIIKGVLI